MAEALKTNPLAIIIDLEKRVRNALTIDELGFIVVNETHKIVQYRQAVLFDKIGEIKAISGVSNFELNSPFILWLKQHLSPVANQLEGPKEISSKNFERVDEFAWDEWLPKYGFFFPLNSPVHGRMGSLFLSRDRNWDLDEKEMLGLIADIYGHSWGIFRKTSIRSFLKNRSNLIKTSLVLTFFLILFIRIPLTVLAPSEIVPVNPSIIRSPIQGVIEKVLVKPNQVVSKGDVLFVMDSLSQRNDLDIAQKIFISLKVQYAQVARQALSEVKSKKFLAEIRGRLNEQKIRIENLKHLINRMQVSAPRGGTVIIDNPRFWEGRPVNLGEKIVSLADRNSVEVESWLSIGDIIHLQKGSPVRLYLNSDPLNPISASLHTFSYEAQQRPGDIYAHRLRSKILDAKLIPRLGLRGTARILGEEVSLIYWIFRRPISSFRQFFGI